MGYTPMAVAITANLDGQEKCLFLVKRLRGNPHLGQSIEVKPSSIVDSDWLFVKVHRIDGDGVYHLKTEQPKEAQ